MSGPQGSLQVISRAGFQRRRDALVRFGRGAFMVWLVGVLALGNGFVALVHAFERSWTTSERPPVWAQGSASTPIPEMARLARSFAGDWSTVEIVQHGKAVPRGAGRRGTVRMRLAGGGTVLVSEGRSSGAVGGELRWLITVWWEPDTQRYRLLTCFRARENAGCELRGTAHWEGDVFVNDYEETFEGKRTRMQDRWTDITPTSHTLTELHDTGNGVMVPYVVSHNTRR